MGRPRLQLHDLLKGITEHVYFQPPSNVTMQYPCIIYERNDRKTEHADGAPYRDTKRYAVTVIDRNPDSPIPDKVAELPMCAFDRAFQADDLNHDVYNLFF